MRYPMNDVVVVLPGIMGSTLHKNGKPVWEPSAGGVIGNLRGLFKDLKSLKLPEAIGDGHPDDGVTAEALLPDIRLPLGLWTFDVGYTRLVAFLTETFELNPDPTKARSTSCSSRTTGGSPTATTASGSVPPPKRCSTSGAAVAGPLLTPGRSSSATRWADSSLAGTWIASAAPNTPRP